MRPVFLEGEYCSTPYGIEGMHTRGASARWRWTWSAQRLSASQESAFGPVVVGDLDAILLNAYWHRRNAHCKARGIFHARASACSTPYGIEGIRTSARTLTAPGCAFAQRLAASQESARNLTQCRSRQPGFAQRLTALKEGARQPAAGHSHCSHVEVLNALRHHRNAHYSRGASTSS